MMRTATSRSQEISDILRDEILRGQYRPGERLPSERDLSSRFETSRGTVREALKKLEQLGLATIQPGGARAAPIEECTLVVLGPLLDLGDTPDPELVDQAMEAGSVLVGFAVSKAMEANADATIEEARKITAEMLDADGEDIQSVGGPPRLIRHFARASDHLVLRLIMNGLRSQVMERLQAVGLPPRHDPQALRAIAEELDRALAVGDTERVSAAMRDLIDLLRRSVQRSFDSRGTSSRMAVS